MIILYGALALLILSAAAAFAVLAAEDIIRMVNEHKKGRWH